MLRKPLSGVGIVILMVLMGCTAPTQSPLQSPLLSMLTTPLPTYSVEYVSEEITTTLPNGLVAAVKCAAVGAKVRCSGALPNGNSTPDPRHGLWSPDKQYAIFMRYPSYVSTVWDMWNGIPITTVVMPAYSYAWVSQYDHIFAYTDKQDGTGKRATIFYDAATGNETHPVCPGWLYHSFSDWTDETCFDVPVTSSVIYTASNQFLMETYPIPFRPVEEHNWWGNLLCPNAENIEPISTLTQAQVMDLVEKLLSDDIYVSRSVLDPAAWGARQGFAWFDRELIPANFMSPQPASQSPYAEGLSLACGEKVVANSWWVRTCLNCERPDHIFQVMFDDHIYILQRNQQLLIWAVR